MSSKSDGVVHSGKSTSIAAVLRSQNLRMASAGEPFDGKRNADAISHIFWLCRRSMGGLDEKLF